MNDKIKEFVRKNASLFVVFVIAIFYIFWGSVELKFQSLDWWELLVYIFTTLIFGISIANLIGETGFTSGKLSSKYVETRKLLLKWCDATIKYKDEAVAYADNEIQKEICDERKNILHRAGISYSEIFNENGQVILSDKKVLKSKYSRKQNSAIRKAIKVQKCDFTLFAYSSTKLLGRKKEQTETEFRAINIGKDFISRVVMSILSGSVMFTFIGFSVGSIIYACFQMILWTTSGIMKRQTNYNFVVITQRDADLDRIRLLKEFGAKKGLIETYEDGVLTIVDTNDHKEN